MSRNNEISFKAGGTIGPALFVKGDTAADEQVLLAGAGAIPIGISQEWQKGAPGLVGSDNTIAAEIGDQITVYGLGDDCYLALGDTVTRFDFLKPDAAGKGVTAAAGAYAGAMALQSGTVDQKIRVVIIIGKI